MTTTDTDNKPGTDLAGTDDTAVAAFRQFLTGLTVEDPAEMEERMLRAILSATTPEDVLRAGEATKAVDVLGIPLRITDLRAAESDYEDGGDYYLHFEATNIGNGDRLTVSTGARDVVLKLCALAQKGFLPVDAKLLKSDKPTKAGFYPIFLRMLSPDETPEEAF